MFHDSAVCRDIRARCWLLTCQQEVPVFAQGLAAGSALWNAPMTFCTLYFFNGPATMFYVNYVISHRKASVGMGPKVSVVRALTDFRVWL